MDSTEQWPLKGKSSFCKRPPYVPHIDIGEMTIVLIWGTSGVEVPCLEMKR
jgi:hypothetical protein